MSQRPSRSWASSILGFAFAVLLACLLLREAARLLWSALAVLLPVLLVAFSGYVLWQRHSRSDRW